VVIDADDRHLYQPGLLFVPFGWPRRAGWFAHGPRSFVPGSTSARVWSTRSISIPTRWCCPTGRESPTKCHRGEWRPAAPKRDRRPNRTGLGRAGPHLLLPARRGHRCCGPGRLRRGAAGGGPSRPAGQVPGGAAGVLLLADWYLRRGGMRDRVELTYVTSLDAVFTKATCNRRCLACWSPRASRWSPSSSSATPPTCGCRRAARSPTPEGEVLVRNVCRYLAGEEPDALRRAHQLLHRDRLRQSAPHRPQRRPRPGARPLPIQGRAATAR
jgi:hypothetical protein